MTPFDERAVDEAIRAGLLIEAIRVYRRATSASLVQARDYVKARQILLAGVPAAGEQPLSALPPRTRTQAPPSWVPLRLVLLALILALSAAFVITKLLH